ncbi:hypothetical protein AMJ57_03330 [Parcubacteria bacterium SG8_24]|nr:MAG: hypothetical protein AMJ57_03330 [Parcubacteria bacterium SG8_24]
MRIHFDFRVSWYDTKSFFTRIFRRLWWSVRDACSPLVRGPVGLQPETFISLLLRHRPKTMMMQWCDLNNWPEGKAFSYSFRAGRTVYVTYFYIEVGRTGYLQEVLPAPFLALAGQSAAIWPIRDPARRLDETGIRQLAA